MARLHARAVADKAREALLFEEDPMACVALAAVRDAFDWFADVLDDDLEIEPQPETFYGEAINEGRDDTR